MAEFRRAAASAYYNAACCYALTGNSDSAFACLKLAQQNGWSNREHLLRDTDLTSLHENRKWKKLLRSMKPVQTWSGDPRQAVLVTTDITNFWDAFDRAQKDTANRLSIYKQYYIDKGSDGLHDYFGLKVGNMKSFVAGHDRRARFYDAIRRNTLTVEAQKPQMMQSFANLKDIYPDARFPPVYFVIGNYTSGGTVSERGLLIGTDQYMRTPDIPVDELSLWEKNNFGALESLPHLIAHELIHFQQFNLAKDTTLLSAALREGMCDFIGELISGKTANTRLQEFAKGREKQIWEDFKKEMWLNRASNWIANSNQETPDKPADLGYWIGHMICKSYYDRATDKKQAIKDILNIKDYKAFYEKSGADEMFGAFNR